MSSLIVSHAARLKPEIRLAEAISQFEASLVGEKKTQFRNWRAQSLSTPPDSTEVMRFTAEMDRSRKAGSRCLGPRFTSFLTGVQQFAALGDVIIGGSQNIIACGIWSLVRMSILALVNFSSHLESLSLVFMEIGRSTPRHQEMALLYPRSRSLQAHINEYYIVVVRFCHDVLQFAQKSLIRQFTTTLSSTLIKSTQLDLDLWASEIKDEISFLIAKRIEEEANDNSKFRLSLKKNSKTTSQQQQLTVALGILDRCSKYDYETTWRQIRKSGNTTLFAHTTDYLFWATFQQAIFGQATSPRSSTLIYYGKLGCGKSVMMANIIDDLNLRFAKQNVLIAYIFVRHDLPDSLKARTVIGTIARQLLQSKLEVLSATLLNNRTLDTDAMLDLLRTFLPPDQKIFLIFDGLDLCDESEITEVINFVGCMQDIALVHACASFREEPGRHLDTTMEFFRSDRVTPILTPIPENGSDISAFIETELARCMVNRSLILGDAALVLEIQDALLKGSNGMFLWVALQIKSLCKMQTDKEIKDALADLPSDLSETYGRILKKSERYGESYQSLILELIISAQSPLEVDQLREALSVIPGDTDWTAANVLNEVYSTLSSCGCLVAVDEEELTVRFVHPSVQDFVLKRYKDPSGAEMTHGRTHKTMAGIIVTYLSYGVFDSQLSTSRVPQIDAGRTPSRVIESVTASSKSTQSLAIKLLSLRKRANFDLGKTLAQELGNNKPRKVQDFVFLEYARRWCLDHVAATGGLPLQPYISTLLPTLLERNQTGDMLGPAPVVAFMLAVEKDNQEMLSLLLRSSSGKYANFPAFEGTQFKSTTPMALAVCRGYDGIIKMLNDSGRVNPFPGRPEEPWTICQAIHGGDIRGVRSYVDRVNSRSESLDHVCWSGRGVLACAVWAGHLDVLELLLYERACVMDLGSISPAEAALRKGTKLELELLAASNLLLRPGAKSMLMKLAMDMDYEEAIPYLERMREESLGGFGRKREEQKDKPPRPRLTSRDRDNSFSGLKQTKTTARSARSKYMREVGR